MNSAAAQRPINAIIIFIVLPPCINFSNIKIKVGLAGFTAY